MFLFSKKALISQARSGMRLNSTVKLGKEALEEAKDGVRVYLLPSYLQGAKRQDMIKYLQESTLQSLQKDDIPTKFNQNQQFRFLNYAPPKKEIFYWSAEKNVQQISKKAPIIYVMTPQNMIGMESGSLYASGLENDYLKFVDHETMKRYTKERFLQKFGLQKKIKFIGIGKFIDGMQDSLLVNAQLEGVLFLFLLILTLTLLLTLAGIFRLANQEKIYVQKFLGFGYCQIYRIPVLLLTGAICLELLAIIVLHLKLGLIFLGVVGAVQFFVLWKYVTKNEVKQLISYFKE
jgi:hypothetical protein